MNLLFRWCFLALMALSVTACETDEDEMDKPNDGNNNNNTEDPTASKYSLNGNWSQGGEWTGTDYHSYRADHYEFTLNSNSSIRVIASSSVDIRVYLITKKKVYVNRSPGDKKNIDWTFIYNGSNDLNAGNYEIVVTTSQRRPTGTIDYSLEVEADISKPQLVPAMLENFDNITIPADPNDTSKSTWLYYSVDIGNGDEFDALDFVIESQIDMRIAEYWDGTYDWIADGKTFQKVSFEKYPNTTYYFRVAPKWSTTPPGGNFDLSINGRNISVTAHGTTDPS